METTKSNQKQVNKAEEIKKAKEALSWINLFDTVRATNFPKAINIVTFNNILKVELNIWKKYLNKIIENNQITDDSLPPI